MARISVLLPVCNGEKFLRKSLDSVSAQTYSDFELLVCDDASSDATPEILKEYALKEPRLRVLRNPVRSGVARTLNKLLGAAGGEFLARMDADDVCEPERFAKQAAFLDDHPEVSFVGTQLTVIDESDAVAGRREYPTEFAEIRRRITVRNPFAHPSMMMRRDAVTSLNGYREIKGAEDYDLWLRAVDKGFVMANLGDALLRYRISPGQEKSKSLKPTLRATLSLQRRYLFKRRFFSFPALFAFAAGHCLLLLPDRLIMKLFVNIAFSKNGKS